jgi:hypothetical protein
MGTRKNEKKATTQLTRATGYISAFESYDITPEEKAVAEFTPDTVIDGQVIATQNFPATPTRVACAPVDFPHKLVYVQQQTPPTGGTIEKLSLLIQ